MNNNYSIWEKSSFFSGYDVLIIGSGIVGLSAAIHLKVGDPKLKIGIIERGLLPNGASTKNAGFACFGSVSELLAQLKTSSENDLKTIVEMRWQGLELLKNLCGDVLKYENCGGFELFFNQKKNEFENCESQIDYLNTLLSDVIGNTDIYSVCNAKVKESGFAGVENCIKNKYEGHIDSGAMMLSLIKKASGLGVILLNGFEIVKFETKSKIINLISFNNEIFESRKILVATNAFAFQLLPELEIKPGRGQILVTKRISNLKINGTFHLDKGYTYLRNVGNRILLGGARNLDFENEETYENGINEQIHNSLISLLKGNLLPNQNIEIDYSWSGIMGFGKELLPEIREVRPNVFSAVRCNGMGVAMGSLSGKLAAELILKSDF